MGRSPSEEVALYCRTGDRICAIPARAVVETMRPLPVAVVPDAPAFVAGIAVIRGAPTPVVDLSALVGGHEPAPTRFVSVRTGDRAVALQVGTVLGLAPLPRIDVEQLPPLVRAVGRSHVEALGVLDGTLLLVLEASRLVPPAFWERMRAEPS